MSQRVNFSANASIYDRRHGAVLAAAVANRLAQYGGLEPGCRVLDIGAGTGRVAIALADIECDVVAFDSSLAMLDELRRKAPDSHVQAVVGEAERLPFANGHFDAVIVARMAYLVADWQAVLREAHRVLEPGGCLLHEWGNGDADEPWAQIREKARSLFEDAGVTNPFHPGARSEAEVDAFLPQLGFDHTNELEVGPGPRMTLREFVDKIVSGEFSYIWNVPKHIQEFCLPRLKDWAENTFQLDESVSIPRQFVWTVYRKR